MPTEPRTHLSAEELEYLRDLFAESRAVGESPAGDRRLLLDPSSADVEILLQLLGADRLQMTAEQGGYLFRFDLHIERPPAGHPVAVRFGYPTIFEQRGRERAARVHPHSGEIAVAEREGRLHTPQVRDISASGISLVDTPSSLTRPGRHHVNLRLKLAETGPLDLEGRVVRVEREAAALDRRTIAIQFEDTDPQTRAILNRYVFRNHPFIQH